MVIRKTYLVTVDLFSLAEAYEAGGEDAITYALLRARYIANPEVTLAPDSFQPINKTEGNNQE